MCKARRYNDQMQCNECSLYWDVDDPEPPECNPGKGQGVKLKSFTGRAAIDSARRFLSADKNNSLITAAGANNGTKNKALTTI